ncbi:MAG: GAF domain-containing protein [Chloroflexota bacterium]|nr:GAF domain-containing protein [Chloroflexota bacterium]
MQKQETWRKFLNDIINDPHERQRIADELGLNPVTLIRWASGETDPRPHNLRRLLTVLPQQREQLLDLLRGKGGFEEFSNEEIDEVATEIPATFYTRVFSARATTIGHMRYWSICNTILQQALVQLDPERIGMAITVVRCMPPLPGETEIRSLRESIGLGTSPWSGNLEQKAMFLGAESLAGYVVSTGRGQTVQNAEADMTLIPVSRVEYEKSAAEYPIMYAGRIAGCLVVSSHQYNYFLSQTRLALIENYANLIALAFETDQFYEPEQIALRLMPEHDTQKLYFANFRDRVATTMIEGAQNKQPVNPIEAEERVWRQLEEELIQVQANS